MDCDIQTPSEMLAIFENNIELPILRFVYRTGSNIPHYAITEGRSGSTFVESSIPNYSRYSRGIAARNLT